MARGRKGSRREPESEGFKYTPKEKNPFYGGLFGAEGLLGASAGGSTSGDSEAKLERIATATEKTAEKESVELEPVDIT